MKTTDEFKNKIFEIFGNEYTVLGEYTGAHNKILIKHNKCGNVFEKSPTNFLKQHCTYCSKKEKERKIQEKNFENFKNKVKEIYNDEYTILSDNYVNNQSKIKFIHNKCGIIFERSVNNFLNGYTCPKCAKEHFRETRSKSTEEFKKEVEELTNNEFTLVSEYINNHTNVTIKHNKCGNTFEVLPNNFKKRLNCNVCENKFLIKKTTEEFKKEVEEKYNGEFTILGEYVNSKEKILVRHNICNHEYMIRPIDLLHPNSRGKKLEKRNCKYCQNIVSNPETEIYNFIKSLDNNLEIIRNSRDILDSKKELDIYIPSKNIAIEFNGLYYHSDLFKDDKNYHLNKTLECEEKGIRLIHIFEDEWINKEKLIKSKIEYILGYSKKEKIYARNCYIEEINNDYKRNFLEENHIQGNDNSNIKLGLWYPCDSGDILVSVMTFVKPRSSLGHKNSKYDYELSRFASENNFIVVGGFSKLLKYFERNYEWKLIVTYADRRWSNGKVYLKNGFILDHISKPNYWYINRNTLTKYHRYKFRKSELKKLFPDIYSDDKTEEEIMKDTIYSKIYDCGNLVFIYSKHN